MDLPSMAVIREELLNVKPSVFENEGFNRVFDSRFSQIVFVFPHKVDTKSLIDLIEGPDSDDIKIDYDKSSSWFTLAFEDLPFSVRVERREFVFESPEMKTPKELLQGFYDVQKLIEGTPLIPALKA
jgi:hypothetical protein